jgi:hypothetical protein
VVIARVDLQAWIEAHISTPVIAPTIEKRVLASVSPAARELLDGILNTQAGRPRQYQGGGGCGEKALAESVYSGQVVSGGKVAHDE